MRQPPFRMSREQFVAIFGPVFEHSDWVAEDAFDRASGCDEDGTLEGLHKVLCTAMRAANDEKKLALIRAHPDLAGKLAVAGDLSEASQREQAGAGLDHCTPEEFEQFDRLNTVYTERFGFPFIMAVKGRDRAAILAALEARIDNGPESEFVTALKEIERIALFRLEDILGGAGE